jgi:hypothetical protein
VRLRAVKQNNHEIHSANASIRLEDRLAPQATNQILIVTDAAQKASRLLTRACAQRKSRDAGEPKNSYRYPHISWRSRAGKFSCVNRLSSGRAHDSPH